MGRFCFSAFLRLWRRSVPTDKASHYLTNVNGTVFFSATDSVAGTELWKSDGTAAGTSLVKDIVPGFAGSYPEHLTASNGLLFFSAFESGIGRELWFSDGTSGGTFRLKERNTVVGQPGKRGIRLATDDKLSRLESVNNDPRATRY